MSSRHLAKGSRAPPSAKGKLRLYSNRFCPCAQRVHLVLDIKKISYDVVYINLSSIPDWFSSIGKVPALETETGDILTESLIIADYLDEKYPQHKLHSNDPLQKAKDRLLLERFNKVIHTMYKVLLTSARSFTDEPEETISEGLEMFENELNNRSGSYFGGSKPGMLDYMIWPWCERADILKLFGNQYALKKDEFKKLMEWRGFMLLDEAVQNNFLDADTHIRYVQSYRCGIPDYDQILAH